MKKTRRLLLFIPLFGALAVLIPVLPMICRLVAYKTSYGRIARDVERLAIRAQLGEPKGVLVEEQHEIEELLACMSMKTHSVMPCGYDYVIDVYCETLPNFTISINTECGYYTSDIPEWLGVGSSDAWYALSGAMRSTYSSFFSMIDTGGSYFYRVTAPPTTDYDSISSAIHRKEGLTTLLFEKDELRRNVYIRIGYTDSSRNYPRQGLDTFMKEVELGEFEGDRRFWPLVESLRESSSFLGCSKVRFKMGSSDYFKREIRVYVPVGIDPQLVDSLRREWEPNEFDFVESDGYPFFIVSGDRLAAEQMARLVSEYGLCENWECTAKQ